MKRVVKSVGKRVRVTRFPRQQQRQPSSVFILRKRLQESSVSLQCFLQLYNEYLYANRQSWKCCRAETCMQTYGVRHLQSTRRTIFLQNSDQACVGHFRSTKVCPVSPPDLKGQRRSFESFLSKCLNKEIGQSCFALFILQINISVISLEARMCSFVLLQLYMPPMDYNYPCSTVLQTIRLGFFLVH